MKLYQIDNRKRSFNTYSCQRDLNIVFTSPHGTSITIIPETFKRAGYTNFQVVAENKGANGDFLL
jgi:phosphomannomutase